MVKEKKDRKHRAIVFSSIAITLVFLSSVTLVPQVHGSTVSERLDDIHIPRDFSHFLSKDYSQAVAQSLYIMNILVQQLITHLHYPGEGIDIAFLQRSATDALRGNITAADSLAVLQDNLLLLSHQIDTRVQASDASPQDKTVLMTLRSYLSTFITFLDTWETLDSPPKKLSPGMENQNLAGQAILNLIVLIILIILFLLDGGFIAIIMGAISAIISGLVFIIGAAAGIVFLLLMGLQGALSLASLFVFLLGILSKVVIKILATLGAPVVGLLAWKITGFLGDILGRLSLGALSIVALLLLLGLPIIILIILSSLGQGTPLLAIILEVIFSVLIKIPGLEDPLHTIWDWLGDRISDWPEWPFDTTPPVISNVTDSPDPQTANGYVNITCTVTDTSGVQTVKVNITPPDTNTTNVSMTKLGTTTTYYYNTTYSQPGSYSYIIWANDTLGAQTNSSVYSFTILDTVPPVISGITDQPDPQVSGGTVYINCTVTDVTSTISMVKVNITGPAGFSPVSRTMKNTGGNAYTNSSAYTIVGQYTYHIFAKDSANNVQISSSALFTITNSTLYS